MIIMKRIALLALVSLTYATPWRELMPDNKEVIYDYHASIKTGTHAPIPHFAEFMLDAKLHVQSMNDGLLLRLSDLKHTLTNKEEEEKQDALKMLPLSDNMKDMLTPFKIIHGENGKADHLITNQKEPEQSLNIKKAIGSIFQMDFEMVKLDTSKPLAFESREKTIFGQEKTLYNVITDKDRLIVHKMHHMKTSHHMYQQLVTIVEPKFCEEEFEEPISHDSQKIYTFIKRTDGHMLKRIECNGGVYFHPFEANSDAQYIFINQTFNMNEIIQLNERMELKSELKHDRLEYVLNENSIPFEHVPDKQILVPIVQKMLEDIVEFTENDHTKSVRPDFKKGQLINRILGVLTHFDMQMLENIHNNMIQRTENLRMLEYFNELLPLIGTHDSMKFIINLVEKNKLNELVAINILKMMPFHVRWPSEKTISDMDSMLRLTGVSWEVQKAAVLSFSTLLHKMHSTFHVHFHNHFTHHVDEYEPEHHEHEHEQVSHLHDLFEKYIEEFLNKIKSSTKLEEQALYFNALTNMKSRHLIRHMEPAIKGELWTDNNLRLRSMLVIAPVLRKDHKKLYELIWPILTDRKLPTNMRTAAFTIIMKSRPSLSTYINIYWLMQNEPSRDLYQFYYTFIKSLSETTNPCLHHSQMNAKKILKYLSKPYLHVLSQFDISDLTNKEFNFGNSIQLTYLNLQSSQVFGMDLTFYAMNIWQSPYTEMKLYIDGLDENMMNDLLLNLKKMIRDFNIGELLKLVRSMENNKNIRIELKLSHQTQIVQSFYFDSTNVKTKLPQMISDQISALKNFKNIYYTMYMKMFIPTDIGFPAVFSILLPTVEHGSINMKKEITDTNISLRLDGNLKSWNDGSFGLSLHNPLLNVWQGINRYLSYSYVLPMNFDLNINTQKHTMNLSWKKHGKEAERTRFHVANMVYIKDYLQQNVLEKTSPGSKHWFLVAPNEKYLHKYTLTDEDAIIYDTEHTLSYEKKFYKSLLKSLFHNKPLLALLNMETYMFVQPDHAIRGIVMEDSVPEDITSLDMSLRLNFERMENGSLFLPQTKIDADMTFTTKNDEKTLTNIDVNTIINMNDGHTMNGMKMQIAGLLPNANVLVDLIQEFNDEGYTGKVIFAQSKEQTYNKDNVVMEIKMKGEKLPEQQQNMHNYPSCRQDVMSKIRNIKPFSCVSERSSIRKVTLDIEGHHDFRPTISKAMEKLRIAFPEDIQHQKILNAALEENEIKLVFEYPIVDDMMTIYITTSKSTDTLSGIPSKYSITDNTQYSYLSKIIHNLGLTDVCTIDGRTLENIKMEHSDLTEDWMLIIGDNAPNTKYGLWAKMINNKLAVKLGCNQHILLIMPTDEKFMITLDGHKLKMESDSFSNDLLHIDDMGKNMLVVLTKHLGLHIVYNTEQMQIEIPKMDKKLVGKCFEH